MHGAEFRTRQMRQMRGHGERASVRWFLASPRGLSEVRHSMTRREAVRGAAGVLAVATLCPVPGGWNGRIVPPMVDHCIIGPRPVLAVRPEGANHQWRRVPPG